MFTGRTAELSLLEESYRSRKNTLTILYGRNGIGKTALLKEFMKDKPGVYYSAPQASGQAQKNLFAREIREQTGENGNILKVQSEWSETGNDGQDEQYEQLLARTVRLSSETRLIVIEEFQNIIRQDDCFMEALAKLIGGELYTEPVMVVCTSSSVNWVENSLLSSAGAKTYAVTGFIKLKELNFADTVRMFPKFSVSDCILLYAVTGGVPSYMTAFSEELDVRENICRNVLLQGQRLRTEGGDYIKAELRETSVYNTILYYIAGGACKLNELHLLTGFGRDKISVYLKNLMEREIVEKNYSWDAGGKEFARKGLYQIQSGYTEFWFKYLYGRESELERLEPPVFFERYIADSLNAFAEETFIKAATQYITGMNDKGTLPLKIKRFGRWWGKNGDIDLVACDEAQHYLVGKCSWLSDVFTFERFEELMYNINLAGIGKDYIYLFSKGTFDEELTAFAQENENVRLICQKDLLL